MSEEIIGAYCTIRWNDSSLDVVSGNYFSFENYNEETETTDSGYPDDQVFYYADDIHEVERMIDPNNTEVDWTVISIDEIVTAKEGK